MFAAHLGLFLLPFALCRVALFGDDETNITVSRNISTTPDLWDTYTASIPLPCVQGCVVNVVGYLYCLDNSTSTNCTAWCNPNTYAEWATCINCVEVEGGEEILSTTPQQILDNTNAFCRDSGGKVNTLTSITYTPTTTAALTTSIKGVAPGESLDSITIWSPLETVAEQTTLWRDLNNLWHGTDMSQSFPATHTYGPATASVSGAAGRRTGQVGVGGMAQIAAISVAVLIGGYLAVY